MRRISIGLMLFTLALVSVQGQSRQDSLETLLRNTQVDTTRARLLFMLANAYIDTRPGRTDTLADELMVLARTSRNGKALGQALNCKGMVEPDYAVALSYHRRALVVCDSVGDKDCMGVAYQGIGNCRRLQGDKKEALSASFAALRLFKEIGATKGIASQYANIGNLYDEQGDLAQALEHYRSAQAIFEKKGQRWPIAAIGANIGRTLNKLGQRKEAMAQYRVSLDLFKQLKNPYGIAMVLTYMSEVLALEEGPAAALKYEQEALALKETIDDRTGMSFSLMNMASFYLALGETDKAAKAADRGVALAVEVGSLDLQEQAYKGRIQVDSVRGDYRQAFADQRRLMVVRDSLFNAANTKQLVAAQMQYDFDMKALADSIAKAEHAMLADLRFQAELGRERSNRNIIIVASAVVLVLLLLLGYSFIKRRQQERKLAAVEMERLHQENVIGELRVREQVGRDIHDDMGAGLSALKLRSEMALEAEPDPAKRLHFADQATIADELMGSMRQIIWAMNGEQSNVEDLVLYTSAYARNYCAQNNVALEVANAGPWPAVELSADQRRNLFLVVKEALHNMVKHAGADSANLRMEWADGLTVEITDNGKGLSLASDRSKGNGLQNMEKRAAALGGKLTIDGSKGTRIRFHIPLTVGDRNKSSVALSGA